MREIRTSGLMSGEGKRSDANAVQTTAPFLDSTLAGRALDKIAAHMGPTECKGHLALAKASESLVGAIAVADDDRVEEAFGEQLLRRLGAARGVDMERDRVIADRGPQPGAARPVFPAKFLDAPAGLVGMAQRRLVLVRKDRLGQRLEQRHEPYVDAPFGASKTLTTRAHDGQALSYVRPTMRPSCGNAACMVFVDQASKSLRTVCLTALRFSSWFFRTPSLWTFCPTLSSGGSRTSLGPSAYRCVQERRSGASPDVPFPARFSSRSP